MKKKLLRLATLALLFTGVASAQTTGSITGVVTDGSTGQPVIGAVVVATSPAAPGEQTAVTDAKGAFTIGNLPAGKYKLQASFEGYKPEQRAELALGENVTLRANLAIVPEAVQLEEVVVTGSRIKRKDLTTAAPVAVINKEQMVTSGKISLGDFLQAMPEQGGGQTAQVNNGTDGSTTIDLRSLGSQRTLVLVNGRRMVGDGGVDLGAIPAAAVERIEVLKDGASAVYGSDAIAGVVNIILKKRMNGTEMSAYAGTSSRGDGNVMDLAATTGTGSEKGNILFSLGYQQSGSLMAENRTFSETTTDFNFQTGKKSPTGNSTTFPNGRFTLPTSVCSDAAAVAANPTVAGACAASAAYATSIGAPGTAGNIVPTFDPATGTSTYAPYDFSLYNTNPTNYIITPAQRTQLFSAGDARLGSWGRAYYESSFVHRHSASTLAPMPLVNNTIPTNVVQVSKDSVYNPFGVAITSWRKRTSEFGDRYWTNNSDALHVVAGVDGVLGDWAGPLRGWSWDANFNQGNIWETQKSTGQQQMSRVAAATGPSRWINPADHSKGAQCITYGPNFANNAADYKVIPGCVPMDVLGGNGALSEAAVGYVGFDGVNTAKTNLTMETVSLTGDLFKLMSDRPAGLALGFENRYQSYEALPDVVTAHLDSSGNNGLPTNGSYSVKEVYAELSIPLVSNMPFVEDLELQLAARYFDYNLFGSDTTYKIGARYTPVRDATLRGTYSTAFRAPTVQELYGGATDSYPSVRDPCNGALSTKSQTTADACRAQGVSEAGSQDPSTQLLEKWLGNPELKPETAKTFTFGVVLEPRWVPNLSVALDYYNIKIDKAIARFGANVILSSCYTGGVQSFCDLVHRNSLGTVDWIDDPKGNTTKYETAGLDFSVRYGVPTATLGRFNFMLDGNLLQYYRNTDAGGGVISGKGNYDTGVVLPSLKTNVGVNWKLGGLGAGAMVRYVGAIQECASGTCSVDNTDARKVPAYMPFNLFASYDFKSAAGTTTILAGVNNVADVQPPYLYNAASANSDPYTYDYIGRYYYARLSQSF
jgi:outer membrane receptor protein involved in Fe transport